MRELAAGTGLFRLACVPVIWAGHFLACYSAVSLACKFDAPSVRLPVLLATLLALALLAWIAARSRRSRISASGGGAASARFLGLATMMLCGLSALAMLWVAFPAAVLPPCAA